MPGKSLFEIIEDAKDGNKPLHDECYFAMLALHSLYSMTTSDLHDLVQDPSDVKRETVLKQSFSRSKTAFAVSPQEWLGDNVPGNDKHDSWRKVSKAIFNKVLEQQS